MIEQSIFLTLKEESIYTYIYIYIYITNHYVYIYIYIYIYICIFNDLLYFITKVLNIIHKQYSNLYQNNEKVRSSYQVLKVSRVIIFSLYITNWRYAYNGTVSFPSSQCELFWYHASLQVLLKSAFSSDHIGLSQDLRSSSQEIVVQKGFARFPKNVSG